MRPDEFLSLSSVMVIGLHDVFRVLAGTATAGKNYFYLPFMLTCFYTHVNMLHFFSSG